MDIQSFIGITLLVLAVIAALCIVIIPIYFLDSLLSRENMPDTQVIVKKAKIPLFIRKN